VEFRPFICEFEPLRVETEEERERDLSSNDEKFLVSKSSPPNPFTTTILSTLHK